MSRLRNADIASVWPGPYEAARRDIRGHATESWATEERAQRAGSGRHGITEPDLRRLLGARAVRAAVPARRVAA